MATPQKTIFSLNEYCLEYTFIYLEITDQIILAETHPHFKRIIKNLIPKRPFPLAAVYKEFGDLTDYVLRQYGREVHKMDFDFRAEREVQELVPEYCHDIKELTLIAMRYAQDDMFERIFSASKNITALHCHSSAMLDKHCPFISRLTELEVLVLDHNEQITGLHLNKLTKLKILSLSGCVRITSDNFIEICKANKLRGLNISECRGIDNAAFQTLVETQTKLVNITVDHCYLCGDVEIVARLPNLQVVTINWSCQGCHKEGKLINSPAKHRAQSLQVLRINKPNYFVKNERYAILKLENLLQLCFNSDHHLKEAFLWKIGTHCPKLLELDVSRCKMITQEGLCTLLSDWNIPCTLDLRSYNPKTSFTFSVEDQMRKKDSKCFTVFFKETDSQNPYPMFSDQQAYWVNLPVQHEAEVAIMDVEEVRDADEARDVDEGRDVNENQDERAVNIEIHLEYMGD